MPVFVCQHAVGALSLRSVGSLRLLRLLRSRGCGMAVVIIVVLAGPGSDSW